MPAEDAFIILHDCRRKKIVKHRHRRPVPPIAVETRRMASLKSQCAEASAFPERDELPIEDSSFNESMHNLIEEQLNEGIDPKLECPDSTPFGDPMNSLGIECFLPFNEA